MRALLKICCQNAKTPEKLVTSMLKEMDSLKTGCSMVMISLKDAWLLGMLYSMGTQRILFILNG